MSVRHDWYQSETKVVITVLLKNAIEKNYAVKIESKKLHMTADDYELEIPLLHPVVVERCSHKAFQTKVEITLAKETGVRWETLEEKAAPVEVALPKLQTKNWDQLVSEEEKIEEKEAQGEAALNNLFKRIYSTSSPEVQKAMNKSFSESGGTVLSTNWNEVGKEKVIVRPPNGTEFREWEK
ncbi:protein SGT1 homolog [Drosophila guanche]|uniref:Blast:Suppressor of G2 allele of SKP1 homolog n=1 Tax=Drosophila guanche TaxID=7266 RepID=A0A3B0KCD6_DROGU|nr:protein SGT1 homolog [Drosophila guanche]SPP82671.1 blast:Suppressor of G2 allele of SKP1 homolog [Drosophila guanche]